MSHLDEGDSLNLCLSFHDCEFIIGIAVDRGSTFVNYLGFDFGNRTRVENRLSFFEVCARWYCDGGDSVWFYGEEDVQLFDEEGENLHHSKLFFIYCYNYLS